MSAARQAGFGVVLVPALLATLGVFLALQALSWSHAGGFEYPLDDVYIHLAMAEQVADGGYGVNAGEYASASSSPLYPLLLAPFAHSGVQRFLPLAWNTLAITASGVFVAMILWRAFRAAPAGAPVMAGIAFLAGLTLNLAAIAATGMEHGPHTAVSLGLLAGLIAFLQDGRIGLLLVAAILLGPLLRFEGLALSLLACGVLLVRGRAGPGLLLAIAATLPLVLFAAFLTRLGLDPLPSSVIVKLDLAEDDVGVVARVLGRLRGNLAEAPGLALAVLAGIAAVAGLVARDGGALLLGLVTAAAVAAHLAFGRIGWMDRYENYILAFAGMATLYLALALPNRGLGVLLSATALVMLGANFYRYAAAYQRWNQYAAASVHLQHGQMARFAQDFARVPVAVNDLGRVAWRNPNYVLDLWGLASAQARDVRLDPHRGAGWAAPLARAHGVELAMIYDRYLPQAPGPGWVRLGTLDHLANQGMLADRQVAFYATDRAYLPALTAALNAFVPTLPEGVSFTFADPGAQQTETRDVTD